MILALSVLPAGCDDVGVEVERMLARLMEAPGETASLYADLATPDWSPNTRWLLQLGCAVGEEAVSHTLGLMHDTAISLGEQFS